MNDIYQIEVLASDTQEWVLVATAEGFVKAVSLFIDQRAASNASTRLTIR